MRTHTLHYTTLHYTTLHYVSFIPPQKKEENESLQTAHGSSVGGHIHPDAFGFRLLEQLQSQRPAFRRAAGGDGGGEASVWLGVPRGEAKTAKAKAAENKGILFECMDQKGQEAGDGDLWFGKRKLTSDPLFLLIKQIIH